MARAFLSTSILGSLLGLALALVACGGASVEEGGGGASGASSTSASAASDPKPPGDHACFATEATCDGKCVNLKESQEHCGACNSPCTAGLDQTGTCVDGICKYTCDPGFAEDQGGCRNFFGAHEPFPNDCLGCNVTNSFTGACGCPSPSSELSLAVQSDCPGMAIRASTRLNLCVTDGASAESDFGGAFQVDDLDGWCGATAKCRVGNPLAGGACACPPGHDEAIGLRSIIRLPCDGGEVGTVVVVCGNKDVPMRTFGGAYQFDDVGTQCRVGNPWTGACSCPAGTTDRVYRVMVDGGAGLYGSTIHLCTL